MKCKNCGEEVTGTFCSTCGQKASVGAVNVPNLLAELSESVFLINRGFFYTLIQLVIRPGHSIRDFLNGKRKRHFKPIAYVLLLSTVYYLISRFTEQNTWIGEALIGFSAYDTNNWKEVPESLRWFAENFAYTNLLLVPIFSLASYLAFLGHRRNYLEHIVLNTYITGQQTLVYALFSLLALVIDSNWLEPIPVLLSMAYLFWAFFQFFHTGNRIVVILRTLLTYILFLIGSTALLSVYTQL